MVTQRGAVLLLIAIMVNENAHGIELGTAFGVDIQDLVKQFTVTAPVYGTGILGNYSVIYCGIIAVFDQLYPDVACSGAAGSLDLVNELYLDAVTLIPAVKVARPVGSTSAITSSSMSVSLPQPERMMVDKMTVTFNSPFICL